MVLRVKNDLRDPALAGAFDELAPSDVEDSEASRFSTELSFLKVQLATIASFFELSVLIVWFFSLSRWPIVNIMPF